MTELLEVIPKWSSQSSIINPLVIKILLKHRYSYIYIYSAQEPIPSFTVDFQVEVSGLSSKYSDNWLVMSAMGTECNMQQVCCSSVQNASTFLIYLFPNFSLLLYYLLSSFPIRNVPKTLYKCIQAPCTSKIPIMSLLGLVQL